MEENQKCSLDQANPIKIKHKNSTESSLPIHKKYFRNYLRSEACRFSSLIISNSVSIEENKMYFKIFMLSLQRPASERNQGDQLAISKILIEENVFPEFKNDINALGIFSKSVMVRHFDANQTIISENCKDQNLYKILKGEVLIKKKGHANVKEKGQFLQIYEDYHIVKNFQAICQSESYILSVPHKLYVEAMKIYLQGTTILKMLSKTFLFASYKRRELTYIFEYSKLKDYTSKQIIFTQKQKANNIFYFIIQGQIIISKYAHQSKQNVMVCRLSDGSIFGEEIIFDRSTRQYSVTVCSSNARILQIDYLLLNDLMSNKQNRMEELKKSKKYKKFIIERLEHYKLAANFSNTFKDSMQNSKVQNKMQTLKRKRMDAMIGGIESINTKINDLSKIYHKRQLFSQRVNQISVKSPLFRRQDFPLLNDSLKRYELIEKRARQIYLTLPAI